MAEFAYNSSINKTTGHSPFEVVLGVNPLKQIDLIPLLVHVRPSVEAEAEAFSKRILEIHDDVSNEMSNAHADLKKRFAKFQEVDLVMV
jgi:hypothetical protein